MGKNPALPTQYWKAELQLLRQHTLVGNMVALSSLESYTTVARLLVDSDRVSTRTLSRPLRDVGKPSSALRFAIALCSLSLFVASPTGRRVLVAEDGEASTGAVGEQSQAEPQRGSCQKLLWFMGEALNRSGVHMQDWLRENHECVEV